MSPVSPFARRLYGLVLRLYPAPFRRLYADDMRAAFEALHRRTAAEEGVPGLARLWARTVGDALVSAARERVSGRGYRLGLRSSLRFPRESVATALSDAAQDIRLAVRVLRRAPAYTAMVVATLALGIGANSAVFSVIHGVLIADLPFPGGGEVVHVVQTRQVEEGRGEIPFSVAEIEDLRREAPGLAVVSEYHRMLFTLTGFGEPDRVRVGVVSHHFFDLLGVRPVLGREFVAAEDRPGADPVLVLGHEYWLRKFGGDRDVVGRSVTLNGRPHRIIGVLPSYPQFPEENDVYMPVSVCPTRSSPLFVADRALGRMMDTYARLAPGTTLDAASAQVSDAIRRASHAHAATYADIPGRDGAIAPIKEELVTRARAPLLLLLAASGFVLLIACANAANLALARANRRVQETAVRAALGAGRARLARQILVEHVIVALVGGLAGLVIAYGGTGLLASYAARFTTRASEVSLDGAVVAFTLATSVATGLLFGAAPAAVQRGGLASRLADSALVSAGRRRRRGHAVLVVGQVSVAFALLAGAALMLRSFWMVRGVDTGLDTEEVIAFEVTLQGSRWHQPATARTFFREVEDRLMEVPGVVVAARASGAPFGAGPEVPDRFHPGPAGAASVQADASAVPTAPGATTLPTERGATEPSGAAIRAYGRTVGPGYFEAVGGAIVAGRPLRRTDAPGAPFVGVVNRTFAEAAFPGESPIGRTLIQCWEMECNPPLTVIGVVEDMRTGGPETPAPPEVYRSALQVDWGGAHVLVRVRGSLDEVTPALSQVVHSVDPDVPVTGVTTLAGLRRDAMAPRRLTASLLGAFAAVAVALTLAGIFGVLSLAASARTLEMGIRRALGAREREVGGLVVREGLGLVAVGLVLGVGLAALLTGAMERLLWGVEPGDPLTLAVTATLFLGVAWLACWLPARRAASLDPSETLRRG